MAHIYCQNGLQRGLMKLCIVPIIQRMKDDRYKSKSACAIDLA